MIDLSRGPNLLLYGEQSAERDLFFASVKNDLRKHAPSVQLEFHYGDNLKSLVQESQNRYAYLHKKHCRTLGDYEQNYPNNEQGGRRSYRDAGFSRLSGRGPSLRGVRCTGRRRSAAIRNALHAWEGPRNFRPIFQRQIRLWWLIVSGLRV